MPLIRTPSSKRIRKNVRKRKVRVKVQRKKRFQKKIRTSINRHSLEVLKLLRTPKAKNLIRES